jgi:hypothetical protein
MPSLLPFYEQQFTIVENMLDSWINHRKLLEAEDEEPILLDEASQIIKNLQLLQADLAIVIAAEQRRLEVEASEQD